MTALKEVMRRVVGDTPLTEIARLSNYSISTVSKALSGTSLPRLRTVQGIGSAVPMSGSVGDLHNLWYAAALEEFEREENNQAVPQGADGPLPGFALNLRKLMLRTDMGPTEVLRHMKMLEEPGSGVRAMSRATLYRMLAGTTLPSGEQFELFLKAIMLRDDEITLVRSRYQELALILELVTSPEMKPWLRKLVAR